MKGEYIMDFRTYVNKSKNEVIIGLCFELEDLTKRIMSLETFMKSEEYCKLSERHQIMLTDQIDIMYDYMRVLGRRIEDYT